MKWIYIVCSSERPLLDNKMSTISDLILVGFFRNIVLTLSLIDGAAQKQLLMNTPVSMIYTANVFAVKFTGFRCVPLKPCKVHVFTTGKWVVCYSL